MGTWNTKINGNDTFQDVYQRFFDLYNQGQNPSEISKKIIAEFSAAFSDYDDRNNSLLGLALAQWETRSLDPEVYQQVKEIIESGKDLEVWKELGADYKTMEKRKKELAKFLVQISTEREKAKRRIRPKFEYHAVHLLTLPAPDGQKTFEVIESHVNGTYQSTSAGITWTSGGGGSVFYFYTQGKAVTARWLDNQTLEIRHDQTIQFAQKHERFFFCGDEGTIKYYAE